MNKKLSIIIPCYNQTALLERNLNYLQKQTFKDWSIVILDDNSSENYEEIVSKFPNLDITYIKNDRNYGAIQNIFNSIFYKTDSPYKISLHEDDILHPQYLQKAVEMLEKDKKISFVVTIAKWFKDKEKSENIFNKTNNVSSSTILGRTDFIRKILDGKHIAFGSVVYRNSNLNQKPDLQKYDVLCDRPFLASLMENDMKMAIIEDRLIFVRDHGKNDVRFKSVDVEHCFNLMMFYKKSLPQPLNREDSKSFYSFSTNHLINAYVGLKNKEMSFLRFIKAGKESGLINLRYINKIGIVGILRVILGRNL